jgi:hypothetical protein
MERRVGGASRGSGCSGRLGPRSELCPYGRAGGLLRERAARMRRTARAHGREGGMRYTGGRKGGWGFMAHKASRHWQAPGGDQTPLRQALWAPWHRSRHSHCGTAATAEHWRCSLPTRIASVVPVPPVCGRQPASAFATGGPRPCTHSAQTRAWRRAGACGSARSCEVTRVREPARMKAGSCPGGAAQLGLPAGENFAAKRGTPARTRAGGHAG